MNYPKPEIMPGPGNTATVYISVPQYRKAHIKLKKEDAEAPNISSGSMSPEVKIAIGLMAGMAAAVGVYLLLKKKKAL